MAFPLVFLLRLLFSVHLVRTLIIPLPDFFGYRVAFGNDMAGLLGRHRCPVHIAQLIRAVFFQNGPDAVEQMGSTGTYRLGIPQ